MISKENETISADTITESLKNLLLARANGSITQDEFERRQALLHAQVLSIQTVSKPIPETSHLSQPKSRLSFSNVTLAVIALIAISVAATTWYMLGKKNSSTNNEVAALGTALSTLPGNSSPQSSSAPKDIPAKNSGGDLSDAAKKLAAKLAKDPSNGDGWLLLARSYSQLRQLKEAADTYAKAAVLLPPDAAMLADWADALVTSRGSRWDQESAGIVSRALAADPKNVKALALAGSEAFSRKDYSSAIAFWTRMKAETKPDSMDAKLANANINEAQSLLKSKSSNTK
ncbi:MAG: tetratricopeptide repeat protein [Rugosibacter sp.]